MNIKYKMEERRIARKNKIIIDIRDAELFINRSKETIQRIKSSKMGEVYVKNQIDKLNCSIEEKNVLLEQLNKDLRGVLCGSLDGEIEEEYKKSAINIKKHTASKDKIEKEKKIEKKETCDASKKYWKGIVNEARNQRQIERDSDYGYKYFVKVCSELPPYMIKNLAEMPNNKGYIWRGVNFYGDLPEEPGPQIIFEKKGNVLMIHEYRLYQKDGSNKKQLLHKQQRKNKFTGTSLMDYMKK